MRAALIDSENRVVNVIVLPAAGGSYQPAKGLILANVPDDAPVGPGWAYDRGADKYAPPPERRLTVDVDTITIGTGVAVAAYVDTHPDAPASVTFAVNGATATVPLTKGRAELEVTATVPGPIDVTVDALPDVTVTIHAEEA